MARPPTPTLAVFLALLLSASSFSGIAALCEYWGVNTGCNYDGRHERPTRCKGLGRRYCNRAAEVKECPEACLLENCAKNTQEEKFYFHETHPGFYWEDLVLANDYDMVFTKDDQVCVQTCWKYPFQLQCKKVRRFAGLKYCSDINCDHDPQNRFVGCHKERPWHKPTCPECMQLFRRACRKQLKRYYSVKQKPSQEYQDLQYLVFSEEKDSSDALERAAFQMDESADMDDGLDYAEPSSANDTGPFSIAEEASSGDGSGDQQALPPVIQNHLGSSEDSSQELRCNDSSDGYGISCQIRSQPPLQDSRYLDLWMFASSRKQHSNKTDENVETVPIIYDANETEFMSFNELEYQVAGNSSNLDLDTLTGAVAAVAGVDQAQVQTVRLFDEPDDMRLSDTKIDNATAPSQNRSSIVTVTAVVWSNDPYSLNTKMDEALSSDKVEDGMAANGVEGFLEGSMTVNVVTAPVEKMIEIFPKAKLYSDQVEEAPSNTSSKFVIIGMSIGGLMLLVGLAAIIALAHNLRRQEAAAKKIQLEDSNNLAEKGNSGRESEAIMMRGEVSTSVQQTEDIQLAVSPARPGSGNIAASY